MSVASQHRTAPLEAGPPARALEVLEASEQSQRPALRPAGALLLWAGAGYLVCEAVTASAWTDPAHSYAANFISDLGATDCSTFQQRLVCSPLHTVMNTAFVVYGVLFALAGLLLVRAARARAAHPGGPGRTPRSLLAAVLAHAVGIVLVGSFHGSTAATADGTVAYHYAGATLAILGGNAAVLLAGRQHRALGLRRWFATASTALGVLGLAAVPVLIATSSTPVAGVVERICVDTIIGWDVMAGIALLLAPRWPVRLRTARAAAGRA